MTNRVQNTKLILWLITGFAAAVGLNRFIFGLGATTNLTDATPWGLWIGFDVMSGVALAGGGFVITAIFYMMRREEFHPMVKPAVLTAFLGYMAVIFGLLFDLGLPWNIWHMIIYWNPHSPLFEVGWCVMLYSAVLFLEFSPVSLEKFPRYEKIRKFLLKFRFVFVLLGIMLSTLHQSSLGSLFLIMPYKLHPLWYSGILPVQFFISAVALGLMMVSFESIVSHWLYKRKSDTNLIAKLGKALVWVLAIYLTVKFSDLILAGKFMLIFEGSRESILFIIEILISAVIPIIIFSVPAMRNNKKAQFTGSLMVVGGMVFNRLNVGGLAMISATGDNYVPSWMEISISLGVVSAAVLVFLYVIEHFRVWDITPQDPENLPETAPTFDYSSHAWLGTPGIASITKYSMAFIISFSIGMSLMPQNKLQGKGIEDIPVYHADGVDTLWINGNQDKTAVKFPHKDHIARIGKNNCIKCHHLNLPRYQINSCWECHTSMYKPVDFFRHNWHSSNYGAGLSCGECHQSGLSRSAESAKACRECHPKYNFTGTGHTAYFALSYTDAMHNLCVSCHREKVKTIPEKSMLDECSTCHNNDVTQKVDISINWDITKPEFNNVILPLPEETEQTDKNE